MCSLHFPFNRKDRWCPAVFSHFYCATTEGLSNESSKKKAPAAARAFRFMDTSPQKQVRETSETWALQPISAFCSNTQSLQKHIYCCTRYSFQSFEFFYSISIAYVLCYFEVKSTVFAIVKIFLLRQEALNKSTRNLPRF